MDRGERRLVATMPLHAITSAYGEEGLRARFAAEIEEWPQADQRRLNQALALAGRLHAADRREQEPYVNHLLRVAIRIMSHYGVRDGDVVCAALLHDAVEDHAAELAPDGTRAAALAALAEEFGARGGGLVAAGTRRAATRTSSTASTSRRACGATRGRGSSRPPTSPTTASA